MTIAYGYLSEVKPAMVQATEPGYVKGVSVVEVVAVIAPRSAAETTWTA